MNFLQTGNTEQLGGLWAGLVSIMAAYMCVSRNLWKCYITCIVIDTYVNTYMLDLIIRIRTLCRSHMSLPVSEPPAPISVIIR